MQAGVQFKKRIRPTSLWPIPFSNWQAIISNTRSFFQSFAIYHFHILYRVQRPVRPVRPIGFAVVTSEIFSRAVWVWQQNSVNTPCFQLRSFSWKTNPVSDLGVVGTSNGLVCLEKVYTLRDSIPVLIWNPSIRKVVMLPVPPGWFTYNDDRYTFHGFGYDEHSND